MLIYKLFSSCFFSFQKYHGRTDIVLSESFEKDDEQRKIFIFVEIPTVKNLVNALKMIADKGK